MPAAIKKCGNSRTSHHSVVPFCATQHPKKPKFVFGQNIPHHRERIQTDHRRWRRCQTSNTQRGNSQDLQRIGKELIQMELWNDEWNVISERTPIHIWSDQEDTGWWSRLIRLQRADYDCQAELNDFFYDVLRSQYPDLQQSHSGLHFHHLPPHIGEDVSGEQRLYESSDLVTGVQEVIRNAGFGRWWRTPVAHLRLHKFTNGKEHSLYSKPGENKIHLHPFLNIAKE